MWAEQTRCRDSVALRLDAWRYPTARRARCRRGRSRQQRPVRAVEPVRAGDVAERASRMAEVERAPARLKVATRLADRKASSIRLIARSWSPRSDTRCRGCSGRRRAASRHRRLGRAPTTPRTARARSRFPPTAAAIASVGPHGLSESQSRLRELQQLRRLVASPRRRRPARAPGLQRPRTHRPDARGGRRRRARGRRSDSAGPYPVPRVIEADRTRQAVARRLCPRTRAGARADSWRFAARRRAGRASRALPRVQLGMGAHAERDVPGRNSRGARPRRRAGRAARTRTRESSRASSSGRRCGGGGSCRPARRSRRGRRRRRSARRPPACSRPANTARRAKRSCSAGVSRSWLQAIVARSVRCRSGADREPPASSGSRCSSRSRSAATRAPTRAAASSIAERQAVEPAADLGDVSVRGEVRRGRPRPAA